MGVRSISITLAGALSSAKAVGAVEWAISPGVLPVAGDATPPTPPANLTIADAKNRCTGLGSKCGGFSFRSQTQVRTCSG